MEKNRILSLSLRMSVTAMILTGIGLALPRLAENFNFTYSQQGLLVSVQYIGFSAAVIIGGALADRFGHVRIMRGSLLGVAAAALLFGSIWTYWTALTAVLFIGIFASILENSITALAMHDELHQDKNNILVQVAFSAGAILLPLFYYLFVSRLDNWRLPYYLVGLMALGMFLFFPRHLNSSQPARLTMSQVMAQYASFFQKPSYLIAPLAMFLYIGAEIGLWAFAPIYFEGNGYGVFSAVISSALIWLLMMLGRMFTVRIVEKLNIIRTMAASSLLAILALILMMFSSGHWAILWISIVGFACAPFFPLVISWMTLITGEKSSSMIAFTMACGTMGPVLLGGLTGILAQQYGTKYIMLLPLVCFAGILALLMIFGTTRQVAKE